VLGVGYLHAPRGDAEVEGAELDQLVVVEVGAALDIGLVGQAQSRVVEGGMVPARRRDRAERDPPVPDEIPEPQGIPRTWEPTTEADDRDIH